MLMLAPLASADVVLSIDGQLVPLDSQLSSITYLPGELRLEINTAWDDLRCALNPEGPVVSLPDPEPGDFVLALDFLDGDLVGEYVIESDGSISQLLGALAGDPVQLEIVTSVARINDCVGQECAVLICTAGGTPIFSDDFNTPPPPQVDLFLTGGGNDTVVAGSGPNNAALQIIASNISNENANNVEIMISNSLPTGVTAGTSSATSGSYDANTGIWSVPALVNNTNETLTLIYSVAASASDGADLCADASVNAADEDIINTADDQHDQCATVVREIDLGLLINNPTEPQLAGNVVNYIVELDTNGPSDASNVVVDIASTLPPDVTLSNSFVSVGSFDGSTWTIPNVPLSPPATRTLNLFYTIGSAAQDGSVIDVSASITAADELLINTADDLVSDTTAISNP